MGVKHELPPIEVVSSDTGSPVITNAVLVYYHGGPSNGLVAPFKTTPDSGGCPYFVLPDPSEQWSRSTPTAEDGPCYGKTSAGERSDEDRANEIYHYHYTYFEHVSEFRAYLDAKVLSDPAEFDRRCDEVARRIAMGSLRYSW